MCKHHASTGLTINDNININNGTLEDTPTSNITNITTITTVVSIMVTTEWGLKMCCVSSPRYCKFFFFPFYYYFINSLITDSFRTCLAAT